MIAEDFALPDEREADHLLGGLARLIELRGVDAFVASPVLLPATRFFPDPVQARGPGVAVLIRRLLAYARLEPRRVDVEIADGAIAAIVDRAGHEHDVERALAWFIDIDDGVYHFGVRQTELTDSDGLLGTLAHEVAHAYRAHHRLTVRTHDVEEQLTDLTTVYLGFGVLTLQSSFQFKTGHYDASGGQRLLYERKTRGYLRPGQLALLLGAQAIARNPGKKALSEISEALAPNQSQAFTLACKRFAADRDALLEKLRVPPEASWPSPTLLGDALVALPPVHIGVRDAPAEHRAREEMERIAFRVAGSRALTGLLVGSCVGFGAGVFGSLTATFWPLTVAFAALGYVAGRKVPAATCSGCAHAVKHDAAVCSSCGTRLVAEIRQPADRFDAEERYRAALLESANKSLQGVRCPRCAFQPRPSDHWACSCGRLWNTFETRGRCPSCDKQWQDTTCLSCRESSRHEDWYATDTVA